MWPEQDRWRAPVGDFPPPWASAWGDDAFGLWAGFEVNGVTQRMRWIEPTDERGFWMGSPKKERDAIKDPDYRKWANQNESDPQARVVAPGFWLAETPCTQAFWAAVKAGDRPSHFKDAADAPARPVEQVSFDDVTDFFAALCALRTDAAPALPSELQWEYACRAGTRTAYSWGDATDPTRANLGRAVVATTPVKTYPANAFGLYDMHGNVWEWCADEWRQRLSEAPVERAEKLAAKGGARRVLRGGSWSIDAVCARSAFRDRDHPGLRNLVLGFRFLLRSQSPASKAAGR